MDNSESIPTCKDCKYCVVRHYCWECSHPESDNTYVDPVTGEHSYPSTCGGARGIVILSVGLMAHSLSILVGLN